MKIYIHYLWLGVLFWLCTSAADVSASDGLLAPIVVQEFTITETPGKPQSAQISFHAQVQIAATVQLDLHLPRTMELTDKGKRQTTAHYGKSTAMFYGCEVSLPQDGEYFVEIGLRTNADTPSPRYRRYTNSVVYFTVQNGRITYSGSEPKEQAVRNPLLRKGTVPAVKGMDKNRGEKKGTEKTLSYTINVQISGTITYTDWETRGVPVRVWLDWDSDNSATTAYTPYFWSNTDPADIHMGYDDADMEGNYSFNFSFPSSIPAHQIASTIRVYASNGNEAVSAYSGSLLQGQTPVTIDISSATDNISAVDVDVTTDANHGSAIRNLTRAHIFGKEKMGLTLSPVLYHIDNTATISFYSPSSQRITFDGFPEIATCYHEYGHYFHHMADDDFPTGGCPSGGHWFRLETSVTCAFTEGWAEFYGAACFDYWYAIELPSDPEWTSGDAECGWAGNIYQFLDRSQGLLCTGQDNTEVEGAVACFFYSLIDSPRRRALNYSGDNDDLELPGALLPLHLANARYYAYTNSVSYIEGFKMAIVNVGLPSLQYNEHVSSVNALYDDLFNNNGPAHSATPTELAVEGDLYQRELIWNDNTCPDVVFTTFDLEENDESGFYVYRKQVSSTAWDGTLAGYTLVHTAAANTTSWIDGDDLAAGMYSYVVVAYNSKGTSIPRSQITLSCGQLIENNIVLGTTTETGTKVYQAISQITAGDPSTYDIEADADVIFCAGSSIVLKEGFYAQPGALFYAHIDQCEYCIESQTFGLLAVSAPEREEYREAFPAPGDQALMIRISPNPSADKATVSYRMPQEGTVTLEVVDIYGRNAISMTYPHTLPGWQSIPLDVSTLPAGMYIVRLQAGRSVMISRMAVVR